MARNAASTPGGVIHVGDYVHYSGRRWEMRASLWEVTGFYSDGTVGLTNGVTRAKARPSSLRPEVPARQ
jgi:hypothetical protein